MLSKVFGFQAEGECMQHALSAEGGSDQTDEAALFAKMLSCDVGVPLVLDLDHTLLATNSLHESLLVVLKRHTGRTREIPFWLLAGRATFKNRLAELCTEEDVKSLPANEHVIGFAEREARRGRRIVLATAADLSIAQKIQSRFPFISEVLASADGLNLKGSAKADQLARLYPDGFLYAGDSRADLHVWKKATGAIFVGRSAALAEKISRQVDLQAVLLTKTSPFRTLGKGLRIHQWAKNALVFVPLILGGKQEDPIAWLQALGAFVALSSLASATYLLNDLWDLPEDRQHWSKRNRPLASGQLSIAAGVTLMLAGGLLALVLGSMLGLACVGMLALYLALSLSYSFRLKREPIVDVFALATLFTMRLALGMVVIDVRFSPWLLVFSMFLFLSLSSAKRQTEIVRMVAHGHEKTPGRGYRAADGPLLLALGVGTMMATVLIMVIYLVEDAFPAGFYSRPVFLWGFPAIIFLWMSRIWLLCHRGELHDDPVAFALRDRASLCYAGLMVVLFAAAVF
jgi:4-hydroxybenzoate polyprenyltransferase